MSSLPRSNSADPEDCSSCVSDWIAEAFECYQPPSHLGQEMVDPLDERILPSCQSCYLGPAYLKLDLLPAIQVHFYKVSKSENSEPMDPRRQLAPVQDSILPPKKRKKRRMWHSLLFRLAKTYYVFPQHALMDVINTEAPFQIFCTFYLSKGCDAINVDISGASGDIYHALKETVSDYQVLCQKMKQLLNVHQQQMNEWIPKTDETTLTTKRKQQNDNKITKRTYNKKKPMDAGVKDHGAPTTKKKTKRQSISDKDSVARQCLHCGVTETPMWRRGPNGGGTLCNACGVKWKNGKLFNETTGNKRNTGDDKRMHYVDSMEPTLHEHTDPLTDDHLLRSTYANDTMNVLATNSMIMTRGDHGFRFSATLSSSSSKCNSPPLVSSFTSSTNSSPPLSMDFQKHPMTLTGKLELEGDTISLAPGADDVEAAALLTLLSQS